jgi:hypothetical protein
LGIINHGTAVGYRNLGSPAKEGDVVPIIAVAGEAQCSIFVLFIIEFSPVKLISFASKYRAFSNALPAVLLK